MLDKKELVAQLEEQLRALAREAAQASAAAAEEAAHGASASEKREDARVALEYAGLARGQRQRADRALRELSELSGLRVAPLPRRAPIVVGAVVEVEDEDSGEGRTFFLSPVGAGMTITGPDGDGYLTVVTPSSPIGRAVLGKRVGDVIDVIVRGEPREWSITWVG
jgi:transcription elongation GreA/GreB family factor